MNANLDVERRLTDLYAEEGATRAPDRVLESVFATVDSTPQRRAVIGVPRRFQPMNSFAKLAVAAVAVLAVGAVGVAVMAPRSPASGPGGVVSPSPSPSPASPTPVPLPTPTPLPTPAALTRTFTSPLNRMSIDYPGGWTVKPATQASTGVEANFGDPTIDTVYEPTLQDHLFLALRSSSIGSQTAEEWLAAQAVATECQPTTPVTVDGIAGTIGTGCDVALVVKGDRGYVIRAYQSGDEAWIGQVYDRAWFLDVLATVKLDPASAGTSPSASP